MCLNQRYPYYFIITIFILFYFVRGKYNLWFYILTELALVYGLFYAVWHVGIEQKILPEKNVLVVEASPSRGIITVKTDAGESSLGYVVAKRISVSKS